LISGKRDRESLGREAAWIEKKGEKNRRFSITELPLFFDLLPSLLLLFPHSRGAPLLQTSFLQNQSTLPESSVPPALGLRVPASALVAFSAAPAEKNQEVKKEEEAGGASGDGGNAAPPPPSSPPPPPPSSLPLFLLDGVSVYRRAAPGAPREPVSLLEIAELLSKGGGGGAGGEEQKPPPRIRAHGTLVDHHAAASLPKGGLAAARAAPLRFGGSARGGSGFFAQPSCEKGTQRPLELRGIRGAVADASAPPCFWLMTRRGWYRVLGAAPEYSETFEKDVRALRLAAAAARLADEEAARAEGGGGGSVL